MTRAERALQSKVTRKRRARDKAPPGMKTGHERSLIHLVADCLEAERGAPGRDWRGRERSDRVAITPSRLPETGGA